MIDGHAPCNIFTLPLEPTVAHDGEGIVNAVRIARAGDVAGACDHIDYAEIPPGNSIGDHRHEHDEEEFYLILDGTGVLRRETRTFAIGPGDLVRNPPGGLHGLRNTGAVPLRLFVFQLRVGRA